MSRSVVAVRAVKRLFQMATSLLFHWVQHFNLDLVSSGVRVETGDPGALRAHGRAPRPQEPLFASAKPHCNSYSVLSEAMEGLVEY